MEPALSRRTRPCGRTSAHRPKTVVRATAIRRQGLPRMYGPAALRKWGGGIGLADMYPACWSARGPWPWWEYARTF